MSTGNRRKIMRMLIAAAVAPALVSREVAAEESTAEESAGLIAPPAGAMRFQRSIIRELADGARISVMREFSISFQRFADGFIVDGGQVSVDAHAPASLSAFTQLERERVETGIFPITLDPFGHIISEAAPSGSSRQIELAFERAMEEIARQPLGSGERSELHQFVSALHQAGTLLTTAMPDDLFSPTRVDRIENRTVPLPTGDIGLVSSHFNAERDSQTGLMRRAMREVLTEVDGSRRQTIELWQLDQI